MNLEFVDRIGRGAFADVWLATDNDLCRRVAVKFFRDTDPQVHRQVAIDHARAIARIRHPRLVTIFGVETCRHPETNEDVLAVIMEHVDGPSLAQYDGPITTDLAARALTDVAGALDAIHDAGLIHDDLHEGNVILTTYGATVIDILYTRSLRDVGTGTARGDKQADIRAFANLSRHITERTGDVLADRLAETYYLAGRAATAAEAAVLFRNLLLESRAGESSRNEGGTAPTQPSAAVSPGEHIYLSWHSLVGAPLPRTHVLTLGTAGWHLVGVLDLPYVATTNHIWTIHQCHRPIRLYTRELLDKWVSGHFGCKAEEEHYFSSDINDLQARRLGDDLAVSLCSPSPAPMQPAEAFEFDRGVTVLGVLGPYVLIEHSDYSYSGGAHPNRDATFLAIDLERMRVLPDLEALWEPDERADLQKHAAVAAGQFRAFRSNDTLSDAGDVEVRLVSARPCGEPLRRTDMEIGLLLKYAAGACYVASDGGWSSYSVTEEIQLRTMPRALARHLQAPRGVLRGGPLGAVMPMGWSKVRPNHPARNLLERELNRSSVA